MKRLTSPRTALLLTLALVAAPLALAQPGGPPPGGSPIEHLTQELGLSDAQKGKVSQIFEEARAKRDAAREADKAAGQTPSRETLHARAQAAQQALLAKLGGVLTPAQLEKFKQIQQERRQHEGPPPETH